MLDKDGNFTSRYPLAKKFEEQAMSDGENYLEAVDKSTKKMTTALEKSRENKKEQLKELKEDEFPAWLWLVPVIGWAMKGAEKYEIMELKNEIKAIGRRMNQAMDHQIGTAYVNLGEMAKKRNHSTEAQNASYNSEIAKNTVLLTTGAVQVKTSALEELKRNVAQVGPKGQER
jgi:ribosomal protein L29